MIDNYGRVIDYMRISVTDLCNLRCRYCMPESGVAMRQHSEILSFEEISEICRSAADIGIKKIRITGGEPLVRKGLTALCSELTGIHGIEDLALTTNGILLANKAEELKLAGVRRVNISIDSLNRDKYAYITRGGDLDAVIRGINAAKASELLPVKLNTVLIGGFNDDEIRDFAELTRHDEIHVRFIELMPVGEAVALWKGSYLPNGNVLKKVPELVQISEKAGVARIYRLPDGKGTVGLINPVSKRFCADCNRIRLTADGKLKPCLHSAEEIPLRGKHGEELLSVLRNAILGKPPRHTGLSSELPSGANRSMNEIGG